MPKNDTTVNGRSPVTKVSDGTVAAFPDVCKTPVGSAIVPIPYPNISKSGDLAKGSKTVKINGAPVYLSDSEFSTSTGDEVGSAKGIGSGTTKGKAFPMNYSFDVKIEGKSVVRNMDLFIGNNRNTPPVPIMQAQPAPVIASMIANEAEKKCPRCGAILKKTEPTLAQVRNAVAEVSETHRNDIKAYAVDAAFGYLGSVATGTVGNKTKPHYGMEPDIRGECGTRYDIDGFIVSERAKTAPKTKGKRWATYDRDARKIETKIRSSLQLRAELRYMKEGRDAFSLVLCLPADRSKISAKGGKIVVS